MKTNNLGAWRPVEIQRCDRPVLRVKGGAAGSPGVVGRAVSLLALAAICSWGSTTLEAAPAPEKKESDAAVAATLDALKKNSASPKDPKALQKAAANLSVILNPALTQQDARKAPEFLQAEAAASTSFFNPAALQAKKLEDPAARRKYEAAMEAFKRHGKESGIPIKPSATDAKQIQALRNDPVWRQRREEAVRALLPPVRPRDQRPE